MMTSSEFADVTLVTADKLQIRAHRSILSACSPVFKNILQLESNIEHPIIYLRGIQYSEIFFNSSTKEKQGFVKKDKFLT